MTLNNPLLIDNEAKSAELSISAGPRFTFRIALILTFFPFLMTIPSVLSLAQTPDSKQALPTQQSEKQDKPKEESSDRLRDEETSKSWLPATGVCERKDLKGPLVYPSVGATYVGGTIGGVHMGRGLPALIVDPYGARQLHRNGRIALGRKCMLFGFSASDDDQLAQALADNTELESSDSTPPGGAKPVYAEGQLKGKKISVFDCKEDLDFSTISSSGCNRPDPNKRTNTWIIAVPYARMAVLARGKYATSDLLSVSTTYAVAAAGVLAALSQGIKNAHTLEISLGAATGAMLLYYKFFVLDPRLHENYMAIFVENKYTAPKSNDADKTSVDLEGEVAGLRTINSAKPNLKISQPSSDLFVESDVVIFKVSNYHDYYNISLLLNAKTGLTFVSETAEKQAK